MANFHSGQVWPEPMPDSSPRSGRRRRRRRSAVWR